MPKYIVKVPFDSPNVSKQKGIRQEVKRFKVGQEVNGVPYEQKPMKGVKVIPSILIDGAFLIPQNNVIPKFTTTVKLDTSSVDDGDIDYEVDDKNGDVTASVDDKTKKVLEDSVSGNLKNDNETKMIGYKTGGIIGGVAGFSVGYKFHKSLIISTVLGAIAGGYIGYTISQISAKKKEEFKKL